jgi:hypothetical protein
MDRKQQQMERTVKEIDKLLGKLDVHQQIAIIELLYKRSIYIFVAASLIKNGFMKQPKPLNDSQAS